MVLFLTFTFVSTKGLSFSVDNYENNSSIKKY